MRETKAVSLSSKHYMKNENEELMIRTLKQNKMSVTHKTDLANFPDDLVFAGI